MTPLLAGLVDDAGLFPEPAEVANALVSAALDTEGHRS